MRKLFPALVVLLSVALAVPAPAQTDATATVAAWNIEGFTSISREDARRIARGVADLDAEVIALSEVQPAEALGWILEELNGLGPAWYRGVMPSQTASLKLAILFKDGVELTDPVLIPGSNLGSTGLRHALAADIRVDDFDFILIALHLKSGREPPDRAKRDQQADVIAQWIQQETAGAEKDVLIVGDYNMIPVQGASNFDKLDAGDFIRFVSSEDLAGLFSHIGSGGTPGNLLDGYGISKDHTQEYIEGSLRIFPLYRAFLMDLATYSTQVSDHLPLMARFRITRDDD